MSANGASEKKGDLSFLELAAKAVTETKSAMSVDEIWALTIERGWGSLLRTRGKTPASSLGAYLYTDVKKPTSLFTKVGARPAKFFLKSLAPTISENPPVSSVAAARTSVKPKSPYQERDLHPLVVWFADYKFNAHCTTIFHEKSAKQGNKHNMWVHPDIVGFSLTSEAWKPQVVQLAQSIGAPTARIYSFELKIRLEWTTLREYFFQAVSNSSWANEGYLVAPQIDDDPDFRDELLRLSQSFGIGVIQLDVDQPEDSSVLFSARERTELDWETMNRMADISPGFGEFISALTNSTKINKPAVAGFDAVLEGSEWDDYLRTVGGKK